MVRTRDSIGTNRADNPYCVQPQVYCLEFLKPQAGTIGQIGGGRKSGTGLIDVAILQSLIHEHEVDPLVEKYGQIILDECHHISAPMFEQVARATKACYVVGFSATVERKDGHHPIIFMQCSPIRHNVSVTTMQASDQMIRTVFIKKTPFHLPNSLAQLKSLSIHDVLCQHCQFAIQSSLRFSPICLTSRVFKEFGAFYTGIIEK